jgi:hypothetical protein
MTSGVTKAPDQTFEDLMRRTFGLLTAIGLLAAIFPATLAAAQPVRLSDERTGLRCELPADAGIITVFVELVNSAPFASLAIWEPDADLPYIFSSQGTASLEGSSLRAGFDLVLFDDPEKVAGSARLAGEVSAAGPLEDFGSRDYRDGNRLQRLEQTIQVLSVSGTLVLELSDGTYEEIDLGPCGGSTISSAFFGANPNAYLINSDQVYISCQWMTDAGTIDLMAVHDDFSQMSVVTVVEDDRAIVGLATPELTTSAFSATHDLTDPATGEPAGSVTADATLSPSGDRITDHEWLDPHRFSTVGAALAAAGTLTLEVDGASTVLAMDDASCDAGDVVVRMMEKIPHE